MRQFVVGCIMLVASLVQAQSWPPGSVKEGMDYLYAKSQSSLTNVVITNTTAAAGVISGSGHLFGIGTNAPAGSVTITNTTATVGVVSGSGSIFGIGTNTASVSVTITNTTASAGVISGSNPLFGIGTNMASASVTITNTTATVGVVSGSGSIFGIGTNTAGIVSTGGSDLVSTNTIRAVNWPSERVHDGYVSTALGGSPKSGALAVGSNRVWLISSGTYWIAYPGIARMKNGGLICTYSIGMSDFDASSAVYYQTSYDDGATWSDSVLIYKNSDASKGSGCGDITVLQDGTVFLTGRDQTSTGCDAWTLTGYPDNSGNMVWGAVSTLAHATSAAWLVGSGPATELFDGSLIVWTFDEDTISPPYHMKMYANISHDHGKTFDAPITTADSAGLAWDEVAESCALQITDGTVVNFIRLQSTTGPEADSFGRQVSTDGGLTWTEPTAVIGPMTSIAHPSVVKLRSGAMHMMSGGSTVGVMARPCYDWTSWDDGVTWTAARRVYTDLVINNNYDGQCLLSGGHIGAVTAIQSGSPHTGIFFSDYTDGYGLFTGGNASVKQVTLPNDTVMHAGVHSSNSNGVYFVHGANTYWILFPIP